MKTVLAIYENGVFRPTETPEVPEGSEVEFEPRVISRPKPEARRARLHALLARRIETGEPDLAATHDEPLL